MQLKKSSNFPLKSQNTYNEKKTAIRAVFQKTSFLVVILYALIASRARQRVDFFLATVFFL